MHTVSQRDHFFQSQESILSGSESMPFTLAFPNTHANSQEAFDEVEKLRLLSMQSELFKIIDQDRDQINTL